MPDTTPQATRRGQVAGPDGRLLELASPPSLAEPVRTELAFPVGEPDV